MKELPFVQTSVFVDDRYQFTGNQLATFWSKQANIALTTEEMQGIALEMNFSETTFIFETKLENCSYKVRIFTPGNELDFAGHPTLGTAFALRELVQIDKDAIETTMELGIGPIKVEFNQDETISMYQPKPNFLKKLKIENVLAEILGIDPSGISKSYPVQVVSTGFPFIIVPIANLDVIQNIKLNPQLQLEKLEKYTTSKLLVFSTETVHDDSDVHVRMFAPSVGVIEDPATGSAAGPLGAYLENWNVLNDHEMGSKMKFEQGFEIRRPSQLIVNNLYIESEITNVVVSGKVRKTAMGEFYL